MEDYPRNLMEFESRFGKYAISTNCQGTPAACAQWPGCGYGDKGYVD